MSEETVNVIYQAPCGANCLPLLRKTAQSVVMQTRMDGEKTVRLTSVIGYTTQNARAVSEALREQWKLRHEAILKAEADFVAYAKSLTESDE